MKKIMLFLAIFALSGCTYSITMVHTEGTATDVVDETSSPTSSVTPNVNIPAL
jgi:uncharacterized protein YceK